MKTFHVLPWKRFSAAHKQQNVSSSKGEKKNPNKSLCPSNMKSGLERGLSPWSEWMMDVGCS